MLIFTRAIVPGFIGFLPIFHSSQYQEKNWNSCHELFSYVHILNFSFINSFSFNKFSYEAQCEYFFSPHNFPCESYIEDVHMLNIHLRSKRNWKKKITSRIPFVGNFDGTLKSPRGSKSRNIPEYICWNWENQAKAQVSLVVSPSQTPTHTTLLPPSYTPTYNTISRPYERCCLKISVYLRWKANETRKENNLRGEWHK